MPLDISINGSGNSSGKGSTQPSYREPYTGFALNTFCSNWQHGVIGAMGGRSGYKPSFFTVVVVILLKIRL
jgi:hypothetical protein